MSINNCQRGVETPFRCSAGLSLAVRRDPDSAVVTDTDLHVGDESLMAVPATRPFAFAFYRSEEKVWCCQIMETMSIEQ